jgi:hypothetical protein
MVLRLPILWGGQLRPPRAGGCRRTPAHRRRRRVLRLEPHLRWRPVGRAQTRRIRCGLVVARGFSLSGLLRAAGHVACLWRCTDGQKPGPCAGVRSATCAASIKIRLPGVPIVHIGPSDAFIRQPCALSGGSPCLSAICWQTLGAVLIRTLPLAD